MPNKALTDRWLKTVKSDRLKEEFVDTTFNEKGTFGVIVSRTGTKRFFHRYRIHGKRRRDILGTYPSLSLAAARELAIDNVSQLNKGSDPTNAKRAYRTADTFCELAELYFQRSEGRLAPSTLENYRKMFKRDLEPAWSGRKAIEITKADVIQLLEHICHDRKAPIKSNRTYELISRIFNYGISRDLVQYNPVRGLEKLGAERKGERVFTHDEIKLFWQATESQRPHIRAIFRLLLLTGQRPGEIKAMEWAHIDKDILTIPGANSKNKRRHQIHLTEMAREEVDLMKQISGERQNVFSVGESTESIEYLNKGHLRVVKQMEKLICEKAQGHAQSDFRKTAIADWTPRDIRRTVQTRMAEMGVRPDVVDRVLNHNVAGVRRHYDHYSYYPEIQNALIQWEGRLKEILSGSPDRTEKVVNLPQRYSNQKALPGRWVDGQPRQASN